MNTNPKIAAMEAMKVKFSTLWIFAMFNYLYCDVLALFDPVTQKSITAGSAGGLQFSQGFLLGSAVLMEIPIAAVLLSRVLKYRANRWANIIAGTIMTAIQFLSLFAGTPPTLYYIFFSAIEIACTLLIVWFAWKWRNPESEVPSIAG